MERQAWVVLEDGTAFRARAVGAPGEVFGEAVFNTVLTGYQEVLTDPSYKGQIVCMTNPHIGNYGVNDEDAESRRPWVEAFVMRELSPIASNHRAQEPLDAYFIRHGVVAVDGVDTRALTLRLRERGSMRCGVSTTEPVPARLLERVRAAPDIVGRDLVKEVTCEQPYEWPIQTEVEGGRWKVEGEPRATSDEPFDSASPRAGRVLSLSKDEPRATVVVMDYGVKYGILRHLAACGFRVTVVPATATTDEVLALRPDGVVLSNGPGDPAALPSAVETIRRLMARRLPILGICLGHQLLGLAYGGETFKLKFGHHGGNHPVQRLSDGTVQITTQNHNFAVRPESLPRDEVDVTHRNLNDGTVEGMRHARLPILSLQYHPEASPGPHDAAGIFRQFAELLADTRR